MTKYELYQKLTEIKENHLDDEEALHIMADNALLEYINDEVVSDFYRNTTMWYA